MCHRHRARPEGLDRVKVTAPSALRYAAREAPANAGPGLRNLGLPPNELILPVSPSKSP
jgi:hypothetical protein